ncbi:MAG: hypothetical protein AB1898_18510 [Acidobacteriota bacterium]
MSEILAHPQGWKSLQFPPACVTGIGSLPHPDPRQAVEFVSQFAPALPFWPQLPRRDTRESMVPQMLGRLAEILLPRTDVHGFEIPSSELKRFLRHLQSHPARFDPSCAAGFFQFERALKNDLFPDAGAVKGQLTGPLTLSLSLLCGQESFAGRLEWVQELSSYLARLAQWQIERFAGLGKQVVLFIDEPVLPVIAQQPADSPFQHLIPLLRDLVRKVQRLGAIVGLHCCAPDPLPAMLKVEPDIFSFDAYENLESLFNTEAGRAILRSDRLVAFGMVPALTDFAGFQEDSLIKRWHQSSPDANGRRAILSRSLITATCGLGLLGEDAARDSFQLARRIADELARSEA